MKYLIQTFGCQMNYSDTERVSSLLEDVGFSKAKSEKDADFVIYNSCSVRQKAEDKVFGQMKEIKKLKKQNPNLLIGVTGCLVRKSSTRQTEKKDRLLTRSRVIDLTFRIEDLLNLPELLKEANPNLKISTKEGSLKNYFEINPNYNSKFQALLPIMTGCDNFCAYCIVPYSRGREKSRPFYEVVYEAEKMVESGIKEITLLGQNVNSYNPDSESIPDDYEKKEPPFVSLLKELDHLKDKGLDRLRFTSSHPKDMSDELIEVLGSLETLCPYVHLPVQSGDNEVLKNMNRNYTIEHYLGLIEKIRSKVPNCAISTDIIVGFPGETEKQFQNSAKLFEEVEYDMAYMAQYSPRKGTYSADKMEDNISTEIKVDRWHKLNDILTRTSLKKNQEYEGKTVEVLVEKCKDGILSGRTRSFKEVFFPGSKDEIGKIIKVKIEKAKEWFLEGDLLLNKL